MFLGFLTSSSMSGLHGGFYVPAKNVYIAISLKSHYYYDGSGTTFDQRQRMRRGNRIKLMMNQTDASNTLRRVQLEAHFLCKGNLTFLRVSKAFTE